MGYGLCFLEYFPSLQRSSATITIYSFFENELNKLCQQCKLKFELTIDFSELKGKGVDRASIYLEKVVGLNLEKESSKVWQEIKNIQQLRNSIVHNDGKISKQGLEDYLNEINEIDLKDGKIIIKNGYLRHIVNVFNEFYRLIDSELQQLPKLSI